MECDEAQRALRATVLSSESRSEARDHVLNCELCSTDLHADEYRESMIIRLQRHTEGQLILRSSLALLSVAHLSLSIPWLFGLNSWWDPSRGTAIQHLTRDGVIALVFSVAAGLSAASRRLAWFSFVPSLIAATLQIAAGIYDYNVDHAGAWFEAIHLLGVVTAVLIALEIRPTRSSSR
jgi:hypothetical protein